MAKYSSPSTATFWNASLQSVAPPASWPSLRAGRTPPKPFMIATWRTPGTFRISSPKATGIGIMKVTALRVTSRRGLRVSITRSKRVSALCSVQKRRMQRAIAATVLAVRMELRRRWRRTKGRNLNTSGRVTRMSPLKRLDAWKYLMPEALAHGRRGRGVVGQWSPCGDTRARADLSPSRCDRPRGAEAEDVSLRRGNGGYFAGGVRGSSAALTYVITKGPTPWTSRTESVLAWR